MGKTTDEGSSISTDEISIGNAISDGSTTTATVNGETVKTQTVTLQLGDADPDAEEDGTLPEIQPVSDLSVTNVDDIVSSTEIDNNTGVDDKADVDGKNTVVMKVESSSIDNSRRRLNIRQLADEFEDDSVVITVKLGVTDTSYTNEELKSRKFNCMYLDGSSWVKETICKYKSVDTTQIVCECTKPGYVRALEDSTTITKETFKGSGLLGGILLIFVYLY